MRARCGRRTLRFPPTLRRRVRSLTWCGGARPWRSSLDAYRVSVDELVAANGLLSANRIFPGQRLEIPAAGAPAQPAAAPIGVEASPEVQTVAAADLGASEPTRQHVVRRGDSLALIAKRYSVSVEALRSRNELASSMIHPGQVLEIPTKN